MTEWSIVTVIIALVGLIVTAAKPLMQVNSTMVHLSEQMQSLTDKLSDFSERNTKSHERIWKHNDEQDAVLDDHEHRITVLEEAKK